jgi:hypothetical protein
MKAILLVLFVVEIISTPYALARGGHGGGGMGHSMGGAMGMPMGGALGTTASMPGTNSLGTAVPSGGPAIKTTSINPVVTQNDKNLDRTLTICRGC